MVQYILFDLDGTLTDSKEGILNSLRFAFEQLGEPVPEESVLIKFIGPPLQDSFREFCGYSPEKAGKAIDFFRKRYNSLGKFENMPTPGLPALCRKLKTAGYTLALASSKLEEMCVAICEKFGYQESLDVIAGSPAAGDWEKADVIREALRRLGVAEEDRSKVLMIGDRKFDVLGAKECGLDCVGVEFFGYAAPGELAEAGAVAVVQTPEELERLLLHT